MTPYFAAGGVELYLGDARHVLPGVHLPGPARVVVVTDPVWPNPGRTGARGGRPRRPVRGRGGPLPGGSAPRGRAARLRFRPTLLLGIPAALPFVRAVWLRLAVPTPKGSVLFSGDVAYVFGDRRAENGRTLAGRGHGPPAPGAPPAVTTPALPLPAEER